MKYVVFVALYERLAETSKKLEKTALLATFLRDVLKFGESKWIYLLRGKVVADYDSREFGISTQLALKAIHTSFGIPEKEVMHLFTKIGDLGDVAAHYAEQRRQRALFSRQLSTKDVFDTLSALMRIEGKGAVKKKLQLLNELLNSATSSEARYIIRTLLGDLRVGVADALLIDAIASAFFPDEDMTEEIRDAYSLTNDFAEILEAATHGKQVLRRVSVVPGKPINVMLAVKAEDLDEAFRTCGLPVAIEYKYDGFRVLLNKNGNEISLFTRRLENVTSQFPDVVSVLQNHIIGESFIFDSEIVGFDQKTKKYRPFEAISQRIRRKYDIDNLIKSLPVEIIVFDVLYYNGKNLMNEPFSERRKILERIIVPEEWKIRPATQIIVNSKEEAISFYHKALRHGEEGIMIKKLAAPYKAGRRVGYMAKLKPEAEEFDLVIVGAEYGTGKRAGWLTSYYLACRAGKEFLEIGKVSSGLKEKEEEGTSYKEMTRMLKPFILKQEGNRVYVSPKIVVAVTYQNIQKSPAYPSGYALRFPRIKLYRPDRNTNDIAKIEDIEREVKKQR